LLVLCAGHKPMTNTTEAITQRPATYGGAWQRARAAYLRKHPLCTDHIGRGQVVAATVVDHIKPHKGDLTLFWDSANWQSLCKLCHDSWKQKLESGNVTSTCNVAGLPDVNARKVRGL